MYFYYFHLLLRNYGLELGKVLALKTCTEIIWKLQIFLLIDIRFMYKIIATQCERMVLRLLN